MLLPVLLSLAMVSVAGCGSSGNDNPDKGGGGVPSATTAPATPDDPTTAEPTAPDPTEAETIDPVGDFTRAYQDERLVAESPGCVDNGNFTIGIDFDTPQIDGDTKHAVYSGCDPGSVKSRLPQAKVSGPEVTPAECLDKIRTQPAHSPIAAAKGLTICFETDARQAEKAAQTQKIIFMTITKVSSVNDRGSLHFTLTAWNVP